MTRSVPFLALLLAFGAAALPLSASAMPAPRDAGIAQTSSAVEIRYQRRHRGTYRAPKRVMGLKPGPDRRRGRFPRLPR